MRARRQRANRLWVWLLRVVGGVSLVAVLLNLAASWREEQAGTPLSVNVGGSHDLAVRIHGQISSDLVEPGVPVDCWFTVLNMGKDAISDVRLSWSANGFGAAAFVPDVQPALEPGEDVTFRPKSSLVPNEDAERFTARAEIHWKRRGEPRSRIVTLGPIRVRDDTEPRLFALSKAYVGVFKELALPIVLLLIPWLLTTHQRQSEADRASWNLMIQKSHANAEHYFLPLAASVLGIQKKLATVKPNDRDSFTELLFQLLLYRKRARILFKRIAGYYLPTRDAERLIVKCESSFIIELGAYIDRETRAAAKDSVGRYSEYHTFKRKNPQPADVEKFRDGLIQWVNTDRRRFEAALTALHVMGTVLVYDINLAYRFWYEEPPGSLPKLERELALLKSVRSEELLEIASDYEAYRAKTEKRDW